MAKRSRCAANMTARSVTYRSGSVFWSSNSHPISAPRPPRCLSYSVRAEAALDAKLIIPRRDLERRRRLPAFVHIPQAKSQVGPGLRHVLCGEIAAVVLAVGTD